MAHPRAQAILDFWFGTKFTNGLPSKPRDALWFSVNPTTDQEITDTFGKDLLKASLGEYQDWNTSAQGRLALIILLDQFPRNIYRGTADAFGFDDQALALCQEGIARGHHTALLPIHRVFFYLPLEHQESMACQDRCILLLQQMFDEEFLIQDEIKNYLQHAQYHRDIIARFGRYPHRNQVLGRISTVEEEHYLAHAGARFGQG